MGFSQNPAGDCNENQDSPKKLFVFIGELLEAKTIAARENYNDPRFSVKYKILERVCGNYTGDTITFNIVSTDYDSSFKRDKHLLLILIKDTAENEDYHLWGRLYYDVFKTTSGQWAGVRMPKNDAIYAGQKARLTPVQIKFSKDAYYSTKGMTREEADIAFPERFFTMKKDKAIPLLGNSIAEIFQYEKMTTLSNENIYSYPELPADTSGDALVVKDIQLEEITQNADSLSQAIENAYQAIKDSLVKDPFNETKIQLLLENCRRREEYGNCVLFFDNLIHNYPDSAKAWLFKAKFSLPRASLADSSSIAVLQQAIKVDSNNYEANYYLALSFYRLFQEQPGGYHAYAARRWFIRCGDIDTAELLFLKYPIIQLSGYLNDSSTINSYSRLVCHVSTNAQGVPVANKYNWYFPVESFLTSKTNWATDYTGDIFRKLRSVRYRLDWFSKDLAWFKEPVLNHGYKTKVYRLLWLRSFDVPVVIRMEKTRRNVVLYWKIPRLNEKLQAYDDTAATYKKSLTVAQWKTFQKLLTTIDYWSMIPMDYLSDGADGAIWLLEAAINNRYKVTERTGYIYPKYTKCLSYLISLTDLTIPKGKMY